VAGWAPAERGAAGQTDTAAATERGQARAAAAGGAGAAGQARDAGEAAARRRGGQADPGGCGARAAGGAWRPPVGRCHAAQDALGHAPRRHREAVAAGLCVPPAPSRRSVCPSRFGLRPTPPPAPAACAARASLAAPRTLARAKLLRASVVWRAAHLGLRFYPVVPCERLWVVGSSGTVARWRCLLLLCSGAAQGFPSSCAFNFLLSSLFTTMLSCPPVPLNDRCPLQAPPSASCRTRST
jgi:hypothetical protein